MHRTPRPAAFKRRAIIFWSCSTSSFIVPKRIRLHTFIQIKANNITHHITSLAFIVDTSEWWERALGGAPSVYVFARLPVALWWLYRLLVREIVLMGFLLAGWWWSWPRRRRIYCRWALHACADSRSVRFYYTREYRNALNHWNNALINVYIELIAIEYNEWPSFGLNYKYIRAWINRNWSILYKKPVIFFSILPISVLTDYNVTWHHPREI